MSNKRTPPARRRAPASRLAGRHGAARGGTARHRRRSRRRSPHAPKVTGTALRPAAALTQLPGELHARPGPAASRGGSLRSRRQRGADGGAAPARRRHRSLVPHSAARYRSATCPHRPAPALYGSRAPGPPRHPARAARCLLGGGIAAGQLRSRWGRGRKEGGRPGLREPP